MNRKISCLVLFFLCTLIWGGCTESMSWGDSDSTNEQEVKFDLSQYEAYGELSCDRIWCSKLVGDWDTPNVEKYAYFNSQGTRVSEWYNREEYTPKDYRKDFVVLENIYSPPVCDYYPVVILDIDGKEIANMNVIYYHYGGGANYLGITDFNSDGIACCYALDKNFNKSLYFVDKQGAHRFKDLKDIRSYSPESMDARKLGKYIVLYLGGSYNYYTGIYRSNGDKVLDLTEAIGGYEISNVALEDEEFNVTFEGADNKMYHCIIDKTGKMVKNPY